MHTAEFDSVVFVVTVFHRTLLDSGFLPSLILISITVSDGFLPKAHHLETVCDVGVGGVP